MATEVLAIGSDAATSAPVTIPDGSPETFVVVGAPFFSNAQVIVEMEFPDGSAKWHEIAFMQAPANRLLTLPGPMKVRFKRRDTKGEVNLQLGVAKL